MRIIIFTLFAFFSFSLGAQVTQPKPPIQTDAPEWVHLLYAETPNIYAVQEAYDAYYKVHPFEQNDYTRYFKRWAILARS